MQVVEAEQSGVEEVDSIVDQAKQELLEIVEEVEEVDIGRMKVEDDRQREQQREAAAAAAAAERMQGGTWLEDWQVQ